MSFDFATNQLCSHQVYFERAYLNPDQKTIPFPYDPTVSSVELYIDQMKIPPSGLYTYAFLPFSLPEPYRIKIGVNDLLYLSFGNGSPQFVKLISGNLTARDLAIYLQKLFPSYYIFVQNKRVVIQTTNRVKGNAFQFVDPRWTDKTESLITTSQVLRAYETLGIVPGRMVKSVKLFPEWSVINYTESPIPNKLIRFKEEILNNDPVIEINYITSAYNCRRCQGTKFEFDYRVKNGNYEIVRNTDLLAQEFDKFLITKIGSHWKWSWLGSNLVNRVGGKGSTGFVSATSAITLDVNQAFKTYQDIKQQQSQRFPTQNVSDAEFPNRLLNLDVQTLPNDPTAVIVSSTIVSKSREPVESVRVVGNPDPVMLAGSTSNIVIAPLRLRG